MDGENRAEGLVPPHAQPANLEVLVTAPGTGGRDGKVEAGGWLSGQRYFRVSLWYWVAVPGLPEALGTLRVFLRHMEAWDKTETLGLLPGGTTPLHSAYTPRVIKTCLGISHASSCDGPRNRATPPRTKPRHRYSVSPPSNKATPLTSKSRPRKLFFYETATPPCPDPAPTPCLRPPNSGPSPLWKATPQPQAAVRDPATGP